jgi:hypothetical protein
VSIRASLQKLVVRAIENIDLPLALDGTIFVVVAIFLMCCGFILALRDNVAGAGTTYVAAIFCFVFA